MYGERRDTFKYFRNFYKPPNPSEIMQQRIFYFLGFPLLFLGVFTLLNPIESLTGFVVIGGLSGDFRLGSGVLYLLGGVFFIVLGNKGIQENGLEIRISMKALERSRKDSFVRANIKRYLDEIERIVEAPEKRGQEKVGEFCVSPLGHRSIRVAWHWDKEKGILYIDDFLYHKSQYRYVDDWGNKAGDKRITQHTYQERGYEAYQR